MAAVRSTTLRYFSSTCLFLLSLLFGTPLPNKKKTQYNSNIARKSVPK